MANRIDSARLDVRGVIIGGGIAGMLAGIVMAMAAMFYARGVFAALPPRRKSVPVALFGGLVWGVVVWAIMSFGIMSWLNPTMYAETVRTNGGWWFVLHLIYGGTLVITPGLVRRVSARWSTAEVRPYPESRRAA